MIVKEFYLKPKFFSVMKGYTGQQFTKDLLRDFLASRFPGLRLEMTDTDTNPIHYS